MSALDDGADQGIAGGAVRRAGCRWDPGVLRVEAVGSLHDAPSVVSAPRDDINLLKEFLTGVGHVGVALGVKPEVSGVPETVGVDLGWDARVCDERVVRRDAVEGAGRRRPGSVLRRCCVRGGDVVNVDPEHLAVDLCEILSVPDHWRVAGPVIVSCPTVAKRDVEVAVTGAKADAPAVVVELRFVDLHQDLLRGHVDPVGVLGIDLELHETVRAVPTLGRPLAEGCAVECKDPPVLPEFGVEGYREETALIKRRIEVDQTISNVQERLLGACAVRIDDRDRPDLVDDKEPARIIAGVREHHRGDKTLGNRFETHVERFILNKSGDGCIVLKHRCIGRSCVRQVPARDPGSGCLRHVGLIIRAHLRPGNACQSDEDEHGYHDYDCSCHGPSLWRGIDKGYPTRS